MAIQFPGAPNTKALEALDWPDAAHTLQQIRDKFMYWSEHLIEHKQGTNLVLTRAEITRQLDRWLDERLDLRGR